MDIKEKIKNIKYRRMNRFEKTIYHFYENHTIKISDYSTTYKLNNKKILIIFHDDLDKQIYILFDNLYSNLEGNLIEKSIVRREIEKNIKKYFGFDEYKFIDAIF